MSIFIDEEHSYICLHFSILRAGSAAAFGLATASAYSEAAAASASAVTIAIKQVKDGKDVTAAAQVGFILAMLHAP